MVIWDIFFTLGNWGAWGSNKNDGHSFNSSFMLEFSTGRLAFSEAKTMAEAQIAMVRLQGDIETRKNQVKKSTTQIQQLFIPPAESTAQCWCFTLVRFCIGTWKRKVHTFSAFPLPPLDWQTFHALREFSYPVLWVKTWKTVQLWIHCLLFWWGQNIVNYVK